jgi:hypothetical protein
MSPLNISSNTNTVPSSSTAFTKWSNRFALVVNFCITAFWSERLNDSSNCRGFDDCCAFVVSTSFLDILAEPGVTTAKLLAAFWALMRRETAKSAFLTIGEILLRTLSRVRSETAVFPVLGKLLGIIA